MRCCFNPSFLSVATLQGGWWPLNILYSLLALSVCIYFLNKNTPFFIVSFILLFIASGSVVDYWWPGLTVGITAYYLFSRPSIYTVAMFSISISYGLALSNGNYWGVFAIILIALSSKVYIKLPRWKLFFYAYYPIYLSVFVPFV